MQSHYWMKPSAIGSFGFSLSKIRNGMHVLDRERTSPAQIAYRKRDALRRDIEQLVLKK